VREAGRDWHIHCYLEKSAAVREMVQKVREDSGEAVSMIMKRHQEELRMVREEAERQIKKAAEANGKQVVVTNPTAPSEDLKSLLERSEMRARDPLLYDVVAIGDEFPVRLRPAPRGHARPRLVNYANGTWTEAEPAATSGEVVVCSCGSPLCPLVQKLGLPNVVYKRQVEKIQDQDQRDDLVRRIRK
jgi:hypothetical protein